eukprot:m.39763 g.39763  ORF g.39763 m.39763 type:complete len:564 (-) comp5576_c0_seq1:220-1911(-)
MGVTRLSWRDGFVSSFNGNLTAVFSLLFDNLVNILTIQFFLSQTDNPPPIEDIISHLFLGSLSGVIIGNIFIFFYTRWLNKSSKNIYMRTCVPFGIDAPTVFFMALSLQRMYNDKIARNFTPSDALETAWGEGTIIVMIIGLVKLSLALLYLVVDFPSKIDPKIFGGCLAGIGIALLGMNNLIDIFAEPLSGLVSLFVFLMVTLPDPETLGWRNKLPHFAWSVIVGVPVYYILAALPVRSGAAIPTFSYGLPKLTYFGHFDWQSELNSYIVAAISFACLVFAGGYSVVQVALDDEDSKPTPTSEEDEHLIGDLAVNLPPSESLTRADAADRNRRSVIRTILFADAGATIITSLCGGLIQTTPYIGHSTYRKLGAGHDYSWMFAGTLIVLTLSGTMTYISQALPATVLKPVFVLIALQIAEFAFGISAAHTVSPEVANTINKYIPALTIALMPSIAQLLNIHVQPDDSGAEMITCLSQGFVITSILWGQVTLSIINGRLRDTVLIFLLLSLLTFFGIIHSFTGKVYYDVWNQDSRIALFACLGYAICAVMALVFVPARSRRNRV